MKFLLGLLFIFTLQIANAQPVVKTIDTKNACTMLGVIDKSMYGDMKKCKSDVVFIVSQGGLVDYAYKIKPLLKDKTLICYQCASMAGVLFSQHKGPRYIKRDAFIMFHQIYFLISQDMVGEQINMTIANEIYKELKKDNEKIAKGFTHLKPETYLSKIANGDWYPSLAEIKKYKLADGVFDARK